MGSSTVPRTLYTRALCAWEHTMRAPCGLIPRLGRRDGKVMMVAATAVAAAVAIVNSSSSSSSLFAGVTAFHPTATVRGRHHLVAAGFSSISRIIPPPSPSYDPATAALMTAPTVTLYRRTLSSSSCGGSSSTTTALGPLRKLWKNTPDPYSYAEQSRAYRRDFYTHELWLKHRAKNRFVGSFLNLFKSGVIVQLADEIGLVGASALFVAIWNQLFVDGYLDWNLVHHDPIMFDNWQPIRIVLPVEPFTLSGAALSLLLVFKTNTSYQRWDEARKAWGAIVNNCRTVIRESAAWALQMNTMADSEKYRIVRRIADCVWLFPRSLQRHLWQPTEDTDNYARDVRAKLAGNDPQLAEEMIEMRHKPMRALYELSCAINDLELDTYRRTTIDKAVSQLCDASGGCERIFGSPVPSIYTRHSARFLELWLFFLPAALYQPFEGSWNHWTMIPASAIIAFFLLGIEELAIQLEEPFTVLPLDKIAGGIGAVVEDHVEFLEQTLEVQRFEIYPALMELEEQRRQQEVLQQHEPGSSSIFGSRGAGFGSNDPTPLMP